MNAHSWRRRLTLVLATATAALIVPFVAATGAAWACGCGAYSPADGGSATVPQETALVRAPGDGTEDIYVSLTLDSDVRTGALLFPVPDRLAAVSAGPKNLFDRLLAITTPPPTPRPGSTGDGNGAGAPAPSVTVENRQAVGPLDVVTLSSGDPAALTAWLTHNGFTAKPALTQAARPYTSAGWAFVAVRLRPGAASSAPLDGRLDPLHLHFRTPRVVYPMRLSALASKPEKVTVFTLAPHALELHTLDGGITGTWAGRLRDGEFPELDEVTAHGTTFLTRSDGVLTPAGITDDFHFTQAATDPASSPTHSGSSSPTPSGGYTSGDVLDPSGSQSVNHGDSLAMSDGGTNRGLWTGIGIGGAAAVLVLLGYALVTHRRREGEHT